jgi:hypothetical protein
MTDVRAAISNAVWAHWPTYGKTILDSDSHLGNRSLNAIMGVGHAAMPSFDFVLADDMGRNYTTAVNPPKSAADVIDLLVDIVAHACLGELARQDDWPSKVKRQVYPGDPVCLEGAALVLVSPYCEFWPHTACLGAPYSVWTPVEPIQEVDYVCLSDYPRATVYMKMVWDMSGTNWLNFDVRPTPGAAGEAWMATKYTEGKTPSMLDSFLEDGEKTPHRNGL